MHQDRNRLRVSKDADSVTLTLPREMFEDLVRLARFFDDWFSVERQSRDGSLWFAGWAAGMREVLLGNILSDSDIPAAAEQAWARYARRHGLDDGDLHEHARVEHAAHGRYRRPIKPWPQLAQLLLSGLIGSVLRGEPTPTLAAMCLELNRLKIASAPDSGATLSRWVNESRRAAGLEGGFRAAISELESEAREQADIERSARTA